MFVCSQLQSQQTPKVKALIERWSVAAPWRTHKQLCVVWLICVAALDFQVVFLREMLIFGTRQFTPEDAYLAG